MSPVKETVPTREEAGPLYPLSLKRISYSKEDLQVGNPLLAEKQMSSCSYGVNTSTYTY